MINFPSKSSYELGGGIDKLTSWHDKMWSDLLLWRRASPAPQRWNYHLQSLQGDHSNSICTENKISQLNHISNKERKPGRTNLKIAEHPKHLEKQVSLPHPHYPKSPSGLRAPQQLVALFRAFAPASSPASPPAWAWRPASTSSFVPASALAWTFQAPWENLEADHGLGALWQVHLEGSPRSPLSRSVGCTVALCFRRFQGTSCFCCWLRC